MVTKEFQQLCEKEFALKQDEAYKGFDRELDNLREHYAYHGLLVSSPRAQAVMDAALLRFDLILDGFENAYLAKFSDPTRMTDEEDVTWLKKIVEEKMEPAIFELRTKVQSDLWEQSCALTRYWQKVESEARKRSQKIREKIEIIQLQKKEWAMQRIQENARYRPLAKSAALLPLPIVSTAKELFAGATGLSGPQLFDFFATYPTTFLKCATVRTCPLERKCLRISWRAFPSTNKEKLSWRCVMARRRVCLQALAKNVGAACHGPGRGYNASKIPP